MITLGFDKTIARAVLQKKHEVVKAIIAYFSKFLNLGFSHHQTTSLIKLGRAVEIALSNNLYTLTGDKSIGGNSSSSSSSSSSAHDDHFNLTRADILTIVAGPHGAQNIDDLVSHFTLLKNNNITSDEIIRFYTNGGGSISIEAMRPPDNPSTLEGDELSAAQGAGTVISRSAYHSRKLVGATDNPSTLEGNELSAAQGAETVISRSAYHSRKLVDAATDNPSTLEGNKLSAAQRENIIPTVEKQCREICGGSAAFRGGSTAYSLSFDESVRIAPQLAKCLLDTDAVNTVWNCGPKYQTKDAIIDYLPFLNIDVIRQLLKKGLNLNLESDGLPRLTWWIGNADNDWVNDLLNMSEKYQNREQRLSWINKTDSMTRLTRKPLLYRLFSSEDYSFSHVKQTALQLAIAKGYEKKTGTGREVKISNLQLASKLLELGADEGINYQEPAKDNTALHIAYARRDLNAIQLLESYGASRDIVNYAGKKPEEMLTLTFNQTQRLLKFHTSPDMHPNTFLLDKTRFNNTSNLAKIKLHASMPMKGTHLTTYQRPSKTGVAK